MLAEKTALLSLILMVFYIYSKKPIFGFLSWITFSLSCLLKVPDFLKTSDYFNTTLFILGSLLFLLISVRILQRNSRIFVDVTAFSALACAVYFPFAFMPELNSIIINRTAELSTILGNYLGFSIQNQGKFVELNGKRVEIILACTAIESISLFAGATLGIRAEGKRKALAFLLSVPVIYVLNLFRNVFVLVSFAYSWFGENSFFIAHHVISKVLSTIALVIIAYIVFKILPELAELIYSLKDEILKGGNFD